MLRVVPYMTENIVLVKCHAEPNEAADITVVKTSCALIDIWKNMLKENCM